MSAPYMCHLAPRQHLLSWRNPAPAPTIPPDLTHSPVLTHSKPLLCYMACMTCQLPGSFLPGQSTIQVPGSFLPGLEVAGSPGCLATLPGTIPAHVASHQLLPSFPAATLALPQQSSTHSAAATFPEPQDGPMPPKTIPQYP
jgi:hypothetical protein